MADVYEHCVCNNKDHHFYSSSIGGLNVYYCNPDDISDNVMALKKGVAELGGALEEALKLQSDRDSQLSKLKEQ